MQPFMSIPSKNRSWSQQVRDEQEAEARRAAQEDLARRGNIESNRQQEEQTIAAEQRKAERMKTITSQELQAMSPSDLVKAYDDGLIGHLLKPPAAGPLGTDQEPSEEDQDATGSQEDENGQEVDQEATGPVSTEELASMTPAEIVKAYDEGRFTPQQPSK